MKGLTLNRAMTVVTLLAVAWWLGAIQHDPYPTPSGPTASEVQAHQDKACESLWRLYRSEDCPEWMTSEPWCREP